MSEGQASSEKKNKEKQIKTKSCAKNFVKWDRSEIVHCGHEKLLDGYDIRDFATRIYSRKWCQNPAIRFICVLH